MIDEKALMQKLWKYYDNAINRKGWAEIDGRRKDASYYSGYVDALDRVMDTITWGFLKEQEENVKD